MADPPTSFPLGRQPLLLQRAASGDTCRSDDDVRSWHSPARFSLGAVSIGCLDADQYHLMCPNPHSTLASAPVGAEGRGLLAEVPSMIITMIVNAISAVTYGSLIYASLASLGDGGPLPPNGVSVWLLSSVAAQMGVFLCSGIPHGIGNGTLEMLPIFHQMFRHIEQAMPSAEPREVVATCVATVFASTASLGIVLIVGAKLGCSKWLRCIPVVVLKGALFGVAIFLLRSTFSETTDGHGDDFSAMLEQWRHWLPAVALGTLVFLLDEISHSPVLIVCVFLAISAAPQAAQAFGGPSMAELTEGGWLLGTADDVAGSGGSGPWYRELVATYRCFLPSVSWLTVLSNAPGMCGLWLTHVLCTLMDQKAIEMMTQTEINLDDELRAVGVGNILSVLVGSGFPTYTLCSQTVTNHKLGGRTKAVGLAKVVGTVPMLFLAQSIVPRLPRALPGCVAWWLGLSFFKETGVDIMLQHSHGFDVLIVACMAVVMTTVGLLEGILLGLLLALVVFTQRFSSLAPVVRATDNATFLHSNNTRTVAQYSKLEKLGRNISVLHLEGYIMFGSSPQLVDEVRPLLERDGPKWVILNFRRVHGLDYSATCDLAALGRRAAGCGRSLVVTELREAVRVALSRARLRFPELAATPGCNSVGVIPPGISSVSNYNMALKVCEDALLASIARKDTSLDDPTEGTFEDPATRMLAECVGDFLGADLQGLQDLLGHFERVTFKPGEVLWRAHEPATFCVGVVDGWLHSLQPRSSAAGWSASRDDDVDGDERLHGDDHVVMEIISCGGLVGFSGLLNQLTYSQDVVVPSDGVPCQALKLRWEAVAHLMEHRPHLANALFRAFLRRQAYEFRVLSRYAATF